jgi:transposase
MERHMHGSVSLREDYSAIDLRKLARQERNGRVALRLTAIAAVLEGASRKDSAGRSGMDRQTLCDWVHRFNAKGPDGLRDAACGRPKRRLTLAQEAAVKAHVLKGPDPEKDGLVRWRCVDIQRWIAAEYQVQYHERTIGKLLHALKLSHISTRPFHPKSDVETQDNFKKTSWLKSRKSCPNTRSASALKSGFRTKIA